MQATRVTLRSMFQVPCAHQALIGAQYLPIHTICILISGHTIHHMDVIQTVNHLVHLVPFLLTLQLYHPPPIVLLVCSILFTMFTTRSLYAGRMLSSSWTITSRNVMAVEQHFHEKLMVSTLEPPNNLVICHEEQWTFSDVQNVTRVIRPLNVYYHPNVSCIRHQNPSFVASEILKYLQTMSYSHCMKGT